MEQLPFWKIIVSYISFQNEEAGRFPWILRNWMISSVYLSKQGWLVLFHRWKGLGSYMRQQHQVPKSLHFTAGSMGNFAPNTETTWLKQREIHSCWSLEHITGTFSVFDAFSHFIFSPVQLSADVCLSPGEQGPDSLLNRLWPHSPLN